jgi:DNA-binding transcriptional LysR family regulator
MILRHLEYLVALARERHFGRAAAACGVTQPTLSAAIRELEAELDVLIAERGQRFRSLTAEGERVVEWARRILADRDALRQEVGSARQGLAGRLVLGVIPTALASIGLLISPFQTDHPPRPNQGAIAELDRNSTRSRQLRSRCRRQLSGQ